MKFGSVCSGIEAASVAWEPLGWQAAWFAEIEPFPAAVLAHHWPTVENLGDMLKLPSLVDMQVVDAPDVLVGGTPCQAFSVAGRRGSLADERGALSLAFIELANRIDEVRHEHDQPPAVVVWENVPGVLSTKDNAFGCFLAGLAGETEPLQPSGKRWTNAGCVFGPQRTVAWRVLDAQYFGVAQRRRRVFVVASARAGFDPTTVLFEPESLQRPSASTEQGGARCPVPVDGGTLCRFRRTDSYVIDVVSSTLTARDNKDARDLVISPDGRIRSLTAAEYELLQGFPVGHTEIPRATSGKRKKAIGNSMAVPVMRWIGERIQQEIARNV